ncbi:MAG: hypothetical protein KBT56_02190 [Paraperlucidibaca sp.]|nr:hypothetical protein [Paraperlucidibaca sp.]
MTTYPSLESTHFPTRMRAAVSLAWALFSRKVGSELMHINKEASMQLQFAYLLQQIMPLITLHPDEQLHLELETSTRIGDASNEIDVLFSGTCRDGHHRIAIELKCYRTYTGTGGLRGATDIFMKDVYVDLDILERYVEHDRADEGIALVMTDMQRLVEPKVKNAKCWVYDISHGAIAGPVKLETPIATKPVSVDLKHHYDFQWQSHGDFWFLELQGQPVSTS